MNFNDEKSPIWIRVCPVYIGSDEANKRCFLHFYRSDLTVDWEHFYSFSVAMIDIEWCVGNASFPRKCPQKPCRPRMLSPAFEDDFKGHPRYSRALRDRSTAGMYAGSMEENNRRHTGGRRESNRESRIEQSADAIRERAVNVKLSECDHRAVQCRLIPFAAESALSAEKALNSVVFTTIWSSEPDCKSLISRDCNASKPVIYG
ncbi:hypothetical protein T01_11450 [Trichinella spiralis]|uniref:Uncharacterized protein n=1 Tax=Trichinella spiralis TaxID=6334 RepID=A0A0V1BRH3_TRISP|nr:hypothetical protein T01_11450 [Trichinella spiralis]